METKHSEGMTATAGQHPALAYRASRRVTKLDFFEGLLKTVGFHREAVLPLQEQRGPAEMFATGCHRIQPAQLS